MKLSIVIICWNDWKVIENCLRSIIECTHRIQYEVIVSDNGSTDGSAEKIRAQFPAVRVVENRSTWVLPKETMRALGRRAGNTS